jgi:pimeloyl-ACP methyl ester carboxylesterase
VTLLIHDWGCFYGFQYACLFPQQVAKIIALDVGDTWSKSYRSGLGFKAILMTMSHQLFLAIAFLLHRVLGLGSLANGVTLKTAQFLRAPGFVQTIHAGMNYPYWQLWTGQFKDVQAYLQHCPIFYAFGKNKPFMFHSKVWLEELGKRSDSKVEAFNTNHRIMKQEGEALSQSILRWLRT